MNWQLSVLTQKYEDFLKTTENMNITLPHCTIKSHAKHLLS